MWRSVRWPAAWLLTAIAFGACLWLAHAYCFSWEPQDQADRWAIAAAFASVMAGAVLAALAWWAGHETRSEAGSHAAATPVQARIFGPAIHLGSGDINQGTGDISITKMSTSPPDET